MGRKYVMINAKNGDMAQEYNLKGDTEIRRQFAEGMGMVFFSTTHPPL